jgi:hypothetical protein
MNQPDLLYICIAALVAVFLLLGFLAVAMRILTTIFPHRDTTDAALLGAVAAAAAAAYPGTRVTRIEEKR